MLFSPFGYALRAGRDSPLRAEAIGIDLRAYQWLAFVLAGALAGLAGARLRLLQGQHLALDRSRIAQSTDGLIMVLLGGVETLTDRWWAPRSSPGCTTRSPAATEFWRAVMGGVILADRVLFPQGLVGGLKALDARWREARA